MRLIVILGVALTGVGTGICTWAGAHGRWGRQRCRRATHCAAASHKLGGDAGRLQLAELLHFACSRGCCTSAALLGS